MNVLVPLHGFTQWNGGLDLVRLMLAGIESGACNSDMHMTLATPRLPAVHRLISALPACAAPLVGAQRFARATARTRLGYIAHDMTTGRTGIACGRTPRSVVRAAGAAGADIIFPSMLVLDRSPIPWVAYIPDFQHVHLPRFFSDAERTHRDRYFRELADRASGIVVNSRVAANDVHEILGVGLNHILPLPFAPCVQPQAFSRGPAEVRCKYGVAERYFIVCNQLWEHKDHATAFEAFAALRHRGCDPSVQLVLTGETSDYREPAHFARLMAHANDLGITPSMRVLGLVPKVDQLALLRGAVALVQPTLYEGGPGGGAVYDAIGLGVTAIVSNIPVNREIDTGDVVFFQAGNPDDLATKLEALLNSPHVLPDRQTLLVAGNERLRTLGAAVHRFLADALTAR